MITNERCLVCRNKTYGALFCKIEHYSEYLKDPKKFSKKEAIKEMLKDRKESRIKTLTDYSKEKSEKTKIKEAKRKGYNFWSVLHPRQGD